MYVELVKSVCLVWMRENDSKEDRILVSTNTSIRKDWKEMDKKTSGMECAPIDPLALPLARMILIYILQGCDSINFFFFLNLNISPPQINKV